MNKMTYANFHGVVKVFLGWSFQMVPTETREHAVQNPSPKRWHKLFVLGVQCSYWGENNPDMKYAIQLPMNEPGLGDGPTVHGPAQKSFWLESRRAPSEPLAPQKETTLPIEHIQRHTDFVFVCYRCWQTCIWHLQTAPWKHLQMCWGNNLDPAAEKNHFLYFSLRKLCFSQDDHTTDTWRSHRIRSTVSH